MAINNPVNLSASSTISGKRNLKLTNCHAIECQTTSTSSGNNNNNSNSNVRYQSRSVSWNRSGSLLAVGSSDATIRLWNPLQQSDLSSISTATICKDVGSITGQNGPIIAATFHPISDHLLCTTAVGTIRIWDVRGNAQILSSTSVGATAVSVAAATTTAATNVSPIIVAVEWNPVQTHIVAVTTHDGWVSIYDTRNLSNSTAITTSHLKGTTNTVSPAASLLRQFQFEPQDRVESCIFDRATGQYILAGVTNRDYYGGMGHIKVCLWDDDDDVDNHVSMDYGTANDVPPPQRKWYRYPAHAGPIYTIATNSTGTQLATGGSDAVVGIWDVPSMTCCTTVSSRTKFIRALSFSHDDQILAIGTEEDVIELVDCTSSSSSSSSSSSTNRIGLANLASSGRSSTLHRAAATAGAEDIAFHPSGQYLLACARTSDLNVAASMSSPVSLLKLTLS
jgi:WD40 repeat protein